MERRLQLVEEDMHKLSRMNETLLATWQDKMAEHFSKGCLEEMSRKWKIFSETVSPLIQQLSKIEKDLAECRNRVS